MIPILFTQPNSIYLSRPNTDCWDAARDARRWPGGAAFVAHPPCRSWSKLRAFAKPLPGERDLAIWAIHKARMWGGVVEHPEGSALWKEMQLPKGQERDQWGGWTPKLDQHQFGHRARKRTWLYIVGVEPSEIPPYPLVWELPTKYVTWTHNRPGLSKRERSATPVAFAHWLIELTLFIEKRKSWTSYKKETHSTYSGR